MDRGRTAKQLPAAYFLLGDFEPGFAVTFVLVVVAAGSVLGRPVFSIGTAFNALRNALSDIAASTFSPARSNSLFLTGCASTTARCFSVSMTAYSSLGMVKLSRTSFGFLLFAALSTLIDARAAIPSLDFAAVADFKGATLGVAGIFFATALEGACVVTVALGELVFAGDDFAEAGVATGAVVAEVVAGVGRIVDVVMASIF